MFVASLGGITECTVPLFKQWLPEDEGRALPASKKFLIIPRSLHRDVGARTTWDLPWKQPFPSSFFSAKRISHGHPLQKTRPQRTNSCCAPSCSTAMVLLHLLLHLLRLQSRSWFLCSYSPSFPNLLSYGECFKEPSGNTLPAPGRGAAAGPWGGWINTPRTAGGSSLDTHLPHLCPPGRLRAHSEASPVGMAGLDNKQG